MSVKREKKPYELGSHKCCCGNAECTDFEDRMAVWGIPLDEITEETIIIAGRADISDQD